MNMFDTSKMSKSIQSLSWEEVDAINAKRQEHVRAEHSKFVERFARGECYLCDGNLSEFAESLPCLHWLLRPACIKKELFKLVFKNFDYDGLSTYLRWVANQEVPLRNINDLAEENKGLVIFEYIVKYKSLEWSFSCKKGDFEGHKNTRFGRESHYHFQMRVNSLPFINFGDFHIPLTKHDQYIILVKRGEIANVVYDDGFGAGMDSLFSNLSPEEILQNARATEDGNATLRIQSVAYAEDGKTISGDDIADLMEESKRTGIPMANLLHKLQNTKPGVVVIGPGEGVPDIFPRSGRGSGRGN